MLDDVTMRSRTTIRTALLVGLLIVWSGCDNFLEPDPESFSSTSNYYRSPAHFEAAINSAYSRLRDQAGISNEAFRFIVEVRMDAINLQFDPRSTGVDEQPMEEWFATSDNGLPRDQWNDIYHTVAQTNVILGRIDGVDFRDQALKNRITGEAQFIRALSYWYAVQMWGDVPLVLREVTSPSDAIPEGRAPTNDVYQQIISDLQGAAENLPLTPAAPGRLTSGAANFLLGRTYLLTGDYSQAVTTLEKVEQSGQYRLLDDYLSIFDPANQNNPESILEIQFDPTIAGQPDADLLNAILPKNDRREVEGVPFVPKTRSTRAGSYMPSKELIDTYEWGDARYDASIRWWEHEGNSQYSDVAHRGDSIAIINKFLWPEHINNSWEQEGNDILFRYADALLSLAEAHWRLGNQGTAKAYVDRVRARADLPPLDLSNVPENALLEGTALETDPLGRAILIERTVELFAEGHRLFDLMRFGVALEVMTSYADSRKEREPRVRSTYSIDAHEILMPIHPEEIAATENALTQNPGWGG